VRHGETTLKDAPRRGDGRGCSARRWRRRSRDRRGEARLEELYEQLPARPQIQAVFYQDGTDGGTDHRLDTSPQAVAAYAADIAAPRYASS
jgi:hypothetical protein